MANDIYLTSKGFDDDKLLNLHLLNVQLKKCQESGYFDLDDVDAAKLSEKFTGPMEGLFEGLAVYSVNLQNALSIHQAKEKLSTSGVYGVSLRFLKDFIEENKISDEMLTCEVVKTIIIPHTETSQQTYISKLRASSDPDTGTPKYFCEFPKESEHEQLVALSSFNHPQTYLTGNTRNHCYFLSHTWNMPFRHLVSIAETKMRVNFTGYCVVPELEQYQDISYFWVDIFCKNQHVS